MFSSFGPMVVHHLQGVVGMMIHVPLYPIDRRAEFLMVVSQLGALGALPCHYLRKMEISVEHNITRFYAPDWFLESVNLLYDWTREQRREAFGQMDDQ
ncbi:ORF22 [Fowl aviadenovirus 10]|nr:ORF22 [Fowl aviadenovirus 10]